MRQPFSAARPITKWITNQLARYDHSMVMVVVVVVVVIPAMVVRLCICRGRKEGDESA
jgi:hypothetical protein